jgi:hypothetical protein
VSSGTTRTAWRSSTRSAPSPRQAKRTPAHDRYIRGSGLPYIQPVTARPISIRSTSDVPSKIVKIVDLGAVSAGQRTVAPRGISTDSARPVRDEFRFWVGPVRDWRAGRRRASVGGRGRPVSWRTPSAGYSATGTSQAHSRADLRLSRRSRYRPPPGSECTLPVGNRPARSPGPTSSATGHARPEAPARGTGHSPGPLGESPS